MKRPQELGTWNVKVKPLHNSVTCLPRQFLIKGDSASESERKIILPVEKDGISFGCRNRTEVWMLNSND